MVRTPIRRRPLPGAGDEVARARVTEAKQLHGKELSFNNIVDMEAAWNCANYFADPTVCIVKHNNPCGVAKAAALVEAYKRALPATRSRLTAGSLPPTGGSTRLTAKEVAALFVEVIIAPSYTPKALDILKLKQNIRIMEMGESRSTNHLKGLITSGSAAGCWRRSPISPSWGSTRSRS